MSEIMRVAFEMAIAGSVAITAVMVLRLLLRRAPKKFICFLWMIAMFRLVCPVAIEGPVPAFWRTARETEDVGPDAEASLSQNTQDYNPAQEKPSVDQKTGQAVGMHSPADFWLSEENRSALETVGDTVRQDGTEPEKEGLSGQEQLPAAQDGREMAAGEPDAGLDSPEAVIESTDKTPSFSLKAEEIFAGVWLFGAVGALVLALRRYAGIRRAFGKAVCVCAQNGYAVKEHDMAGLPVAFGVLHPTVYVPVGFMESEGEAARELILAHETMHLRRRDPLLKLLLTCVLCLYWWNPLVWLMARLLQRDIEMAVDEAVLDQFSEKRRQEYAKVLLFYAARESAILLPAAFGTSDTEKRIRNILRYKKLPVLATAAIVVVVGISAICLITRPSDGTQTPESENGQSGIEQEKEPAKLTGDDTLYASLEDWRDACLEHWKLETTVLDQYGVETLYPLQIRTVENVNINDLSMGKVYESELSVAGLLPDYSVVTFRTDAKICRQEDGYRITDISYEILPEITTLAQAIRVQCPFLQHVVEAEDVPYYRRDSQLRDVIRLQSQTQRPEVFELLQDPVTAVEHLLRLKGGTGRYLEQWEDGGIVEYTFADGSVVHYCVSESMGVWSPKFACEYYWEKSPEREKNDREWFAKCDELNASLKRLTAEDLRSVTQTYDASQSEMNEKEEAYILLSELPDEDAALYGKYGLGAMVLRVGDSVYPIRMYWMSPQMWIPQLFSGDYDGDGDTEYALKTHMKTGTGVSGDQLYIIEVNGETAAIHEFTFRDRMTQLERLKVTYTDSRSNQVWRRYLKVQEDGADGASCFLNLDSLLDSLGEDAAYESLEFGDIESFLDADGQWLYAVSGGIATNVTGPIQYECSVEVLCPVQYQADGTFTLGRMQLKPYYRAGYEPVTEKEEVPEKVLSGLSADLTHDGVKDEIVVSVTCVEDRTEDFRAMLTQGEVCIVRVYDGSEHYYDEEKWAATGGYDTKCARWEQELNESMAGEGMVFLVRKNHREYLMKLSAASGQGDYSFRYEVLCLLPDQNMPYEVDKYSVTASLNDLDPESADRAIPVEEMLDFAAKLDDWMQENTVVAILDAELGSCIYGEEATEFEPWRIWQRLEREIDELLFDAALSSQNQLQWTEKVPLDQNADLREVFQNFRERLRTLWNLQGNRE